MVKILHIIGFIVYLSFFISEIDRLGVALLILRVSSLRQSCFLDGQVYLKTVCQVYLTRTAKAGQQ